MSASRAEEGGSIPSRPMLKMVKEKIKHKASPFGSEKKKRIFIILVIPFILSFLIFGLVYHPYNSITSNDRLFQEPKNISINTEVQINKIQDNFEKIFNIPSLDYYKICFSNKGIPNETYYEGEFLVIHSSKDNESKLIIPYNKTTCLTFEGNSYTYSWNFIWDYKKLCDKTCFDYIISSGKKAIDEGRYIPPKYNSINFTLYTAPTSGNFQELAITEPEFIKGNYSSHDFTNDTIKPIPFFAFVKSIIIFIVLIGLVLLGISVWKFINYGIEKS